MQGIRLTWSRRQPFRYSCHQSPISSTTFGWLCLRIRMPFSVTPMSSLNSHSRYLNSLIISKQKIISPRRNNLRLLYSVVIPSNNCVDGKRVNWTCHAIPFLLPKESPSHSYLLRIEEHPNFRLVHILNQQLRNHYPLTWPQFQTW